MIVTLYEGELLLQLWLLDYFGSRLLYSCIVDRIKEHFDVDLDLLLFFS